MLAALMDVLALLSSSQGRRDQIPNQALAKTLAASGDTAAIADLMRIVTGGKHAARHDAIVVAYEVAATKPELMRAHAETFFKLLSDKDNRMRWGAMDAILHLLDLMPERVMKDLNALCEAADTSSVIAKDRLMAILSKLNANPAFAPVVTPVILTRLRYAAVNQTPMYAELAAETISDADLPELLGILEARYDNISYPAKKARLAKLQRTLEKRLKG